MKKAPKFVIGIGSQRAGSTLLYTILDQCTEIFMHPLKELHYYDTMFRVRDQKVLKEYTARQLEGAPKDLERVSRREHCFYRANRILNRRNIEKINYIDLYRPCVMGSNYLGEVTPEYMILPKEGLIKMKEDVGTDAKIILIARNPVKRFLSSVKLLKMYTNKEYDMSKFNQDIEEVLVKMQGWVAHQKELNDYRAAMMKYRDQFREVLLLCYDDFVTQPEKIRLQLEHFLDLQVRKDTFDRILQKRVNALGETGRISEENLHEIQKLFENQQEYLAEQFGEERCRL